MILGERQGAQQARTYVIRKNSWVLHHIGAGLRHRGSVSRSPGQIDALHVLEYSACTSRILSIPFMDMILVHTFTRVMYRRQQIVPLYSQESIICDPRSEFKHQETLQHQKGVTVYIFKLEFK